MKTEKIWELYSFEVYKFILSRTKDRDIARDLLQEVFIKVHLKKEELRDMKLFKNWIFSIARNTFTDHYRKRGLTQHFIDLTSEDAEGGGHSPEDCLRPIIEKLPEKYREAVALSDIHGKKQAEVAQKLNISLSAAKSRIRRARLLIQQGYIKCCGYELKGGLLVGETKPAKECKVCE